MKNRLKIITAIMLTLIYCMQPVCNVQATEESNLSEAQQEKKTLENDLQKAKRIDRFAQRLKRRHPKRG